MRRQRSARRTAEIRFRNTCKFGSRQFCVCHSEWSCCELSSSFADNTTFLWLSLVALTICYCDCGVYKFRKRQPFVISSLDFQLLWENQMPEKRTTLLMKQVSILVNIWKMLILQCLFLFHITSIFFFCNYCYSMMSCLKSMSELTNRSASIRKKLRPRERKNYNTTK